MEEFTYFADPLRFAHLADPGTPCDFCATADVTFDGGGFCGSQSVRAICPRCLKAGRLAEIGASTNEVAVPDLPRLVGSDERARELILEIEHRTPALPTWQGGLWPFFGGEFPRFIKIASRPDFVDQSDLFEAIPDEFTFGHDAEEFWNMLPHSVITSVSDGNYDTSFYLFRTSKRKVCTWDCS